MHAVRQQYRIQLERDHLAGAVEGEALTRRIAGIPADPVPLQIARQPRRAVALYALGRRAEDAAHRKELFRDQLFRAWRKDLQRAVETFLDRADHAVVDGHVEDDLRITGLEFLQHVR